MIKGIVFNQAFWIQKTDDVAHKLRNYSRLEKQVADLKYFKQTVMEYNGQMIADPINVSHVGVYLHINKDGNITASERNLGM